MAQLRKEIKLFIVQSLAVFNTPQETVESVNVEFKVKVTRQQCERYDPTKRAGQELSPELKDEFWATRNAFLESPKNIPVANLSYRLQVMQNVINNNKKNNVLVLNTLEQAAKDVGGLFTNKKEITGADGKPLTEPKIYQLTPEAAAEIVKTLKDEY